MMFRNLDVEEMSEECKSRFYEDNGMLDVDCTGCPYQTPCLEFSQSIPYEWPTMKGW